MITKLKWISTSKDSAWTYYWDVTVVLFIVIPVYISRSFRCKENVH